MTPVTFFLLNTPSSISSWACGIYNPVSVLPYNISSFPGLEKGELSTGFFFLVLALVVKRGDYGHVDLS